MVNGWFAVIRIYRIYNFPEPRVTPNLLLPQVSPFYSPADARIVNIFPRCCHGPAIGPVQTNHQEESELALYSPGRKLLPEDVRVSLL